MKSVQNSLIRYVIAASLLWVSVIFPSAAQQSTSAVYSSFSKNNATFQKGKKAYTDRDYKGSKAILDRLLRFYPEEALIYKQLALANIQLGQFDLALQQMELAYLIDPSDFEILAHQALFAALQGNRTNAIQYADYLSKMVNQDWLNYLYKYMLS